ncbi:hypothetical protein KC799_08060, partial [candidate division KSB1 bacterium]|nr:hypothetical protein [candidate division KSB1 bacterium]
CGEYGTIMQTKDTGQTWEIRHFVEEMPYSLNKMFFISPDTGTVVGELGRILHTIDGGKNWSQTRTGTAFELYSVHFLDSMLGLAVGATGTIFKTVDGGETWIDITPDDDLIQGDDLLSVYLLNRENWFIGGSYSALHHSGSLYHSTDMGVTWSKTPIELSDLHDIKFIDQEHGLIVGGSSSSSGVFQTVDGGNSWQKIDQSAIEKVIGSVFYMNIDTFFVTSRDGIFKTTRIQVLSATDSFFKKHSSGVLNPKVFLGL